MTAQKQVLGLTTGVILFVAGVWACTGQEVPPPPPPVAAPVAMTPAPPVANPEPAGPLATILMSQAQFVTQGGKPKPGPAKLVLWRTAQ